MSAQPDAPSRGRFRDRHVGLLNQFLSVGIAAIGGTLLIIVVGENPLNVFSALLNGSFGSVERVAGSLLQSTPIIMSGVAACIAFRAGLFNIGIEGQLYVGGFAAAWVGFSFDLPPVVHVIAALCASLVAGGLWIAVPAFFRARFGTNEVVTTILSNYVAILLTSYLTIVVFKRPGGWSETEPIAPTAYLPHLMDGSRLNLGILIAIVAAVLLYVFLNRTSSGYSLNAMGRNRDFAQYGGVNIKKYTFWVLIASGAVGGLAGGIETLGVHRRFMEGFAPGFGFDGVIAALLANGHPLGTILTSIFFGSLRAGSLLIEVETNASREIITVFQAIIILCVSAQIIGRGKVRGLTGERRWKI